MDVIRDILKNGPIAPYSLWTKSILLSVFSSIVCTLIIMLVILLVNGYNTNIQFGY
ncbi:hypothetical protein MTsPCn5_06140 [Croceitalea sp. MTPC5]|uniref:hypothetical protein n=1 Tax=Croceitalea sp. MTPC5 TaxID=3056565 RepID=UPI002B3EBAEB|nr:hypothetical protein MTsPCn5_06140 [Croceitalea sp. MTPC5]